MLNFQVFLVIVVQDFTQCIMVRTGFWWGSLRETAQWGDPELDVRIILRRIFRKWEGVVGTGWICFG